MTSSILPPRSALAPCSPSTQATASTTFDLPEPFGPTTQVMPGSKRSVVAEAKDLKPFSVRLLRCTVLRGRTAAGPAREGPSYRPYPVRAGANGTRAARRPAQVVRAAAVLRTGPAGADIAGTGPRRADATPGRARAARPIAAAPAPGRWSGARYAVARPRLPGRVLAPEGMSPRRGGGDPEQHRHSREGPSPSRGPPHQTLRCVLGRARGTRTDPVRATPIGSHAPAAGSTSLVAGCVHGLLTLCEPGDPAARFGPTFDYSAYPSGRAWSVQGVQQRLRGGSGPLCDHFHPAVLQIRRPTHQAELQRPGPLS